MLANGKVWGGEALLAEGKGGIGSPSEGATTLGLRNCEVVPLSALGPAATAAASPLRNTISCASPPNLPASRNEITCEAESKRLRKNVRTSFNYTH